MAISRMNSAIKAWVFRATWRSISASRSSLDLLIADLRCTNGEAYDYRASVARSGDFQRLAVLAIARVHDGALADLE